MTLNISLHVPDGIILASDSLATQMEQINNKMNLQTKCPSCQHQFEQKDIQTPPVTFPISTWPYAQKMFPIQGRFGLATFGNGFVNGRSIYNHVIELPPKCPTDDGNGHYFEKLSGFIVQYFRDQLLIEWKKSGIDENMMPDDFRPFGFQFAGFTTDANEDPQQITHFIRIGKNPDIMPHSSIGCIPSGDSSVLNLLWQNNANVANYGAFSLQNAVDYAKFLIQTTSDFQRFFRGRFRTVGGGIDVALITNHRGFQWIEQKSLYRMLDKQEKAL